MYSGHLFFLYKDILYALFRNGLPRVRGKLDDDVSFFIYVRAWSIIYISKQRCK